jgi:hypothetical protein
MKVAKGIISPALTLVAAAVVVVSPAFATPQITASSGSRAVSPFITPVQARSPAQNSESTALSTNSRLGIPALGANFRCSESHVSGYVDTATHTQVRLTSMSFGNNVPGSCRIDPIGGAIPGTLVTCTATTRNPWMLHVRTIDSATSSRGSVNLTSACTFVMNVGTSICRVTFAGGQSLSPVTYTWAVATRRLTISEVGSTFRVTIVDGGGASRCTLAGSFAASFTGDYTITPDTRSDAVLTVTAGS